MILRAGGCTRRSSLCAAMLSGYFTSTRGASGDQEENFRRMYRSTSSTNFQRRFKETFKIERWQIAHLMSRVVFGTYVIREKYC